MRWSSSSSITAPAGVLGELVTSSRAPGARGGGSARGRRRKPLAPGRAPKTGVPPVRLARAEKDDVAPGRLQRLRPRRNRQGRRRCRLPGALGYLHRLASSVGAPIENAKARKKARIGRIGDGGTQER